MKEVSKYELKAVVKRLSKAKAKWHYHLMTPTCGFNDSDQFVIIVEDLDGDSQYTHHSDTAKMELSNHFSKLLHGQKVVEAKDKTSQDKLTRSENEVIDTVKELTKAGVAWHHHVFFPGCTFNQHVDEFELVLEDPRSHHVIASTSKEEPKAALKHIESVFYAQKSAK